jgi:hypothetical protein
MTYALRLEDDDILKAQTTNKGLRRYMGVIENRFNMKITEEELLDLIATDVELLGFKTSISFFPVT